MDSKQVPSHGIELYSSTTSSGASFSQAEQPIPLLSNPFRMSYIKQHKRRLMIFVVMNIVFTVLSSLLIFHVIVPAVTRSIMKHNVFRVEDLFISNFDAEHIGVTLNQTIGSVPFNPRVEGFVAQIYTDTQQHLFDLDVPSFQGSRVMITPQRVKVSNQEALGSLSSRLLVRDVTIGLIGTTYIHVLTRRVKVSMNKTMKLSTLGLTFTVDGISKFHSNVTTAHTTVVSHGQVSVDLGESHLALTYGADKYKIAGLAGPIVLRPGNNSVPLTVVPTVTLANVSSIPDSKALLADVAAGIVPFTVQGQSNGVSMWANETIRAVTHSISINSTQLMVAIA